MDEKEGQRVNERGIEGARGLEREKEREERHRETERDTEEKSGRRKWGDGGKRDGYFNTYLHAKVFISYLIISILLFG